MNRLPEHNAQSLRSTCTPCQSWSGKKNRSWGFRTLSHSAHFWTWYWPEIKQSKIQCIVKCLGHRGFFSSGPDNAMEHDGTNTRGLAWMMRVGIVGIVGVSDGDCSTCWYVCRRFPDYVVVYCLTPRDRNMSKGSVLLDHSNSGSVTPPTCQIKARNRAHGR